LFRPFRARVSVWVPLTQAVGLGFVKSPLWGSPAHPLPPRRGKTDYARRRVKTVFSFSRRWTATGVLISPSTDGRAGVPHVLLVVGMRGHFPRGPAANKEYSFILLHPSADKRSGGVSGALRGGGKIKSGVRKIKSGVRGPESGVNTSSGCAARSPLVTSPSSLRFRLRTSDLGLRTLLRVVFLRVRLPVRVSARGKATRERTTRARVMRCPLSPNGAK